MHKLAPGVQRWGVSAALAAAAFCSGLAHAAPPNILFIFSDDHAYQAIGAYGSRINKTPQIDKLAVEGLRFDRCYVPNSICAPSRATILTGKYSHRNGVFVNGGPEFDGAQPTFPKQLQATGYQTALIGKWHLTSAPTGFDYYDILIGQGPYYNPRMIRNGKEERHTGYTTEIIRDLALDWLKNGRDPNRPFLLMFQQKAPHRPWDPGPNQLKLYRDVNIPEPPTLFEEMGRRGLAARQQDMMIAETLNERDLKLIPQPEMNDEQRVAWDAVYGPENEAFRNMHLTGDALVRWKYQRYIKDYLRCIAGVDEAVGQVLAYLDESGLTKNTVVIYCADQGFFLGEHGWFDKRWMYEESLRTPLLVRWPGVIAPGSTCDAIVSTLDICPTLLEIAGAKPSEAMDGRSLVPIMQGQTPPDWRKTFYYHYYEFPGWHSVRRHYGVTDGRYKLIYFYEKDVNEWELYDLYLDPMELHSVYGDPVFAPQQQRLTAELARLRKELNVPETDPLPEDMDHAPARTRPQEQ